uniref:Uncharacterized protein n=1 Tax=Romanomermis culicivorax TaxID=13658 RepID=A0A915JM38_ROMCU
MACKEIDGYCSVNPFPWAPIQ